MMGIFVQPFVTHLDKSKLLFDDMKHVFNPCAYA